MKNMIILCVLLFFASAHADKQCTYQSEDVSSMPPLQSQGSTDFCYGFASTALLQVHYCKSKPNGCHYDEDRLSVFDVLSQGNHGSGGLNSGGSSYNILQAVQRQGSVFLDQCAPFSQMLSADKIWKKTILDAKKRFDSCVGLDQRTEIASALRNQIKLKNSSQDIVNVLGYSMNLNTKEGFGFFAAKIFIPQSCESQRVQLKPYQTHSSAGMNYNKIKEKMDELLTQKTPVVLNICSRAQSEDQACMYLQHALVVHGVRKKCCANKCENEYKIFDSAKPLTFSKTEISADDWVSEPTIRNRVETYLKIGSGDALTWIDSK